MPIGTGANLRRIARVRSTKQSVLCAKPKLNRKCRKKAQMDRESAKHEAIRIMRYSHPKKQLSGNEHKVPIGTGANNYIDSTGLQVS